jgi:hypothetical protein
VDGHVRVTGAREIDLQGDNLDGRANEVEGLSGSPCLVGGGAIGVVSTVLSLDGLVQKKTLFVVPMTAVAADCGLDLILPAERTLPYEAHFEAAIHGLQPLKLSELGTLLRIAGFDRLGVGERARYIARMMLLGGAPKTIGAVRACGTLIADRTAKELVELSLSLWVNAAAAKALGEALKEARFSVINTSGEDTAKEYVARACFAAHAAGVPFWQKRCVSVLSPNEEPIVDRLVEKIGQELAARKIRVRPTGDPVILLLREVPRPELVAAVTAKHAGLRVIFLAEERLPSDPLLAAGVEYIEPLLLSADETRALLDREEVQQFLNGM